MCVVVRTPEKRSFSPREEKRGSYEYFSENGQENQLIEPKRALPRTSHNLKKGHTRLNRRGTNCYDLYQLTQQVTFFFRGLGKKVSIVLDRDFPRSSIPPL